MATGPDPRATWRRLRARFGFWIEPVRTVEEITTRVEQWRGPRVGASVIRRGDGAGTRVAGSVDPKPSPRDDGAGTLFASSFDRYPSLRDYGVEYLCEWHFGDPTVLAGNPHELRRALHDAVANAAVVGFNGPWVFEMLTEMPPEKIDARAAYGVASVFDYLEANADALRLADKVGGLPNFSRMLLPHYGELARGRDLGLISGHDLSFAIRERWRPHSLTYLSVPKMAPLNELRVNTHHYPERYGEIRAALDRCVRPGMLWFVGAGFPGKVYCDDIRARGGVAVDVGAVADIWAGLKTRWRTKDDLIDQHRLV